MPFPDPHDYGSDRSIKIEFGVMLGLFLVSLLAGVSETLSWLAQLL